MDEPRASARAEALARLDVDHGFFARTCVKIVGPGARTVPLLPKPAQQDYYDRIEARQRQGEPVRVIIVKARKLGFSTATASLVIQRVTRRENHHALIVAQDNDTAGEIFAMTEFMYSHLPAPVKPPIANYSRGRGRGYLYFGEKARDERSRGNIGLNSSIGVTNAKDIAKGRGFTYRSVHCTEVAHWDYEDTLVGVLNAVPDEPDTFVCLESTANGTNFFKRRWDEAVAGVSSFIPIFAAWHDEAAYTLTLGAEDEQRFWDEQYGRDKWGEDEPRLVEQFGCTAGQLLWRRRAIVDRCRSDIDIWNQEFPASAADAFITSGRHVFTVAFIKRVIDNTNTTDPLGERGILTVSRTRPRLIGGERVEVPAGATWAPKDATGFGDAHPFWRIWTPPRPEMSAGDLRARHDRGEISVPAFERLLATAIRPDGTDRSGPPPDNAIVPPGQYVEAVDVAGGEENTSGERAWHAIQIIDHHTLEQVAEWRSRVDTDVLAKEALLGGLYFHAALIAVEITGGWGTPVVKDGLWRRYGYNHLYRRNRPDQPTDKPADLLGWDTNRRTKPQLEAGFAEQLREGTDGVRSALLAAELLTYIIKSDGKSGPESGSFSDLLMAYMIAQQVAQERRPRIVRPRGAAGAASYIAGPRDPFTGY